VRPLIPDFDPATGCLPAEPQFHDATVDEVRAALVESFPGSVRRPRIMQAYVTHCGEWCSLVGREPREQWMDGSFATTKAEPGDVDLVTFIPVAAIGELGLAEREAVYAAFLGRATPPTALCHAFYAPVVPPSSPRYHTAQRHRHYWQGVFGHQRKADGGHPKGIIRLQVGGV
jgi:hypothetical protein